MEGIGYGNLSGRGKRELRDAAVRMRERLPELFRKIAGKSERIEVVNSGKGRAIESGNAFTAALTAADPALKPLIGPASTDRDLLYFHNSAGGADYQAYLAGDERLAARLQEIREQPDTRDAARGILLKIFAPAFVDRIFASEFSSIGTGFDAAQAVYELYSIAPTMSVEGTWDLKRYFDPRDVSRFAYLSDANSFYRKGPGFADSDITYKMADVLLDDFFAKVEAKRAGTSDLGAALRFAHEETVLPLAVLLGLPGTEKPATPEQPYSYADNPWRGESVSPMAANIQWDVFKNGSTYLVRMLHNEKETPFKQGCKPVSENSMFYDLDELRRCYGREGSRAWTAGGLADPVEAPVTVKTVASAEESAKPAGSITEPAAEPPAHLRAPWYVASNAQVLRWHPAPSIRAFFHRPIAALWRRPPASAASGAAAQEPGAAAGSATEFAPLTVPEGGGDFGADVMDALDAIVTSPDFEPSHGTAGVGDEPSQRPEGGHIDDGGPTADPSWQTSSYSDGTACVEICVVPHAPRRAGGRWYDVGRSS
jgi:hypothetical protein